MSGTRLNALTLAATLAIACGSARAADYPQPIPQPQPPPIVYQQPVVEEFSSGWYLRGDIGIGMNAAYKLDVTNVPADSPFVSKSIGDSIFIGGGVGYEWNRWLRFDATAEYRAKTSITALSATTAPGPVAVDQYQGNLKSWLFLANAYVDLGTWDCWTPFVGVGIGGVYNMITNFTDVTPSVDAFGASGSSFGLGRGTSTWNLAWAAYAGVSYNVSKNFKIDLTYRYLNLGSAQETVDCNGGSGCNVFTFKNLHSNDIMLGFRWTCCETDTRERLVYTQQTYAPPPVYTPPPVYQPPLRSKG